MDILEYLKKDINLTPTIENKLEKAFKREYYNKGQHILLPFGNSQKIIFIERGLIRSYYTKIDKDITHHFFMENSFVVSLESIFYKQPSTYGWEILEETTIRYMYYQDFESYVQEIPGFEKFIREQLIEMIVQFSNKLYSIQFQTAQDRYASLLENFPGILQRASLGHIASYLGITQQTLSVIRGRKN